MPWNPGLTKLRDLLTELYPTAIDSRRLVDQAGLSTARIAFSPSATTNWHNILTEAQKMRMVKDIVAVARAEYPARDAELTQAENEYLAGNESELVGVPKMEPETAPGPVISVAVIRDLLQAAFRADDLRRLFVYTSNRALQPVTNEFGPGDGLTDMVEKVIQYCQTQDLLPDLLVEVKKANPRQYAHFEARLQGLRHQ